MTVDCKKTAQSENTVRDSIAPRRSRSVLVLSSTFPSCADRNYGVFVKERLRAVADLDGHELRVVAPTPYFPPLPVSTRWSHWSRFPRAEFVDGLDVRRPRYFLPPKIGGYIQPALMYRSARRAVERLRSEGFDFDLVDSHFVFPNGVVGAMLAEKYHKPLVITGRGEDILRFPGLPMMGRSIRWAVQRASQFIALSEEIAEAFERQGAPTNRITVIPNGVDIEKFRPIPKREARLRLDLPPDRPIIVSVGNRQERKGFHLLVDAIPKIQQAHPDMLLVIAGGAAPYGNDYTPEIQRRIAEHGLQDHVRLLGGVAHEDLLYCYSAADVFALLSSREGSPNVLMEALACGTPAVATPVGGIPQTLAEPHLGIVLQERSVAAAADGLITALGRDWDTVAIRRTMESRSWQQTAESVAAVFERALSE
ncbi:MAG: glycosyltransferase [Planctomycetaceae bacterium]